MAHSSEGRLQEGLGRLEEWTSKDLVRPSKSRGKVLHLGKCHLGVQHRLGSAQLGSSSVEMHLEVLVGSKLSVSEQ